MLHVCRHVTRGLMGAALSLSVLALAPGAAGATERPHANSNWTLCNDTAVKSAPRAVWWRIQGATEDNSDIPASFWSNTGYRGDIAKIICYESTYDFHAENASQYGWFQMSQSLIASEHVSWTGYWYGTKAHLAGWYQCLAGERYILHRYHNPLAAWEHERDYGWY